MGTPMIKLFVNPGAVACRVTATFVSVKRPAEPDIFGKSGFLLFLDDVENGVTARRDATVNVDGKTANRRVGYKERCARTNAR